MSYKQFKRKQSLADFFQIKYLTVNQLRNHIPWYPLQYYIEF